MGRTLPPPSDVPRSKAAKSAKATRRESAGTSRAGAARGRAGVHAEGGVTGKAASRGGERPHRPASRERPPVENELALRMMEALRAGNDVRARKVRRLKAAIKVRAYENELKFQVALERMKSVLGVPGASESGAAAT